MWVRQKNGRNFKWLQILIHIFLTILRKPKVEITNDALLTGLFMGKPADSENIHRRATVVCRDTFL